jgi:hypothetical protein
VGWIADDVGDEHEGWVANVVRDGRSSAALSAAGVHVRPATGRYPERHGTDLVPWDEVVLWRVTCQCGWTGPELPAEVTGESGWKACSEDLEDREFLPAWQAHVAPYAALSQLGELTEELRTLSQQVDDKVQLARATGASWSQIGREAGLSKQGAQQRWGQLSPGGSHSNVGTVVNYCGPPGPMADCAPLVTEGAEQQWPLSGGSRTARGRP